jgi:acyl-CoA synthetase (AMP-forming)/AMP-acid ligase II
VLGGTNNERLHERNNYGPFRRFMNLGFGVAGMASAIVTDAFRGTIMNATVMSPGLENPTGGSVLEVIRRRARDQAHHQAILSPGRAAMTNSDLLQQVQQTCDMLRFLGIARHEVVALCLPNGPDMTVAFLAVMASAVCAPLNPASTESELKYYLGGLKPKAIIVHPGPSPARDVARKLGIPTILQIVPDPDGPAGRFAFDTDKPGPYSDSDDSTPDDIALLLYTSGTTSRAKLVPLSHRNLMASARNVAAPLGLSGEDRCLNVMPLFHSHGLLGATWAAIASGGSVICPAAFSAVDFFDVLTECQPTWYTAVPTVHQAILARAAHLEIDTVRSTLRLARSASSSMPPSVMTGIERLLGVPLLESYGMTEAGLQIACNPPPPRPRKPGSVGVPFGTEVAIMGESGHLLPSGQTGEIVVKGESLFGGYADNPSATAEAFANGWLRTGDQGHFDEDGYLFITGRLKEIINRGGELIAPREIEEVLLAHPAVAEAIAFSIPDKRLGEEIGAGVVFRPGQSTTEHDLREFLAAELSALKLPRKILALSELPKTPVGKLDRLRAAMRLGLTDADRSLAQTDEFAEPRSELERLLAARWRRALRIDRLSVNDSFLRSGETRSRW